jgi:lysophospholipase
MTEHYSIIQMADRTKIRLGIFEPESAPKGVIQLIHGFGEYIGHYLPVIEFFVEAGYACVMHDQRGHGVLAAAKPKIRGYAKDYSKFLTDCLEVRNIIANKFPNLPVFLFGHSLGGNIVLNLLLTQSENQKRYQKAIVESPWLDLANPPAKITQILAKNAGKISSKLRVHSNLDLDVLIHDKKVAHLITKDGIFHDLISLRLFSQIKEAGESVQNKAAELELPTLLFCAENDRICSAPAMRAFAEKADEKLEFVEIKDGYHVLHHDTQAQFFLEKCAKFLES